MKRALVVILVVLILAVLAVAGTSYWTYRALNTPVQHSHATEFITIQKGSSPREIVDQLANAGILSSPTATMVYLRTAGDGSKLQAGEYLFPSPITTLQVLKQLEKGQDQTIKLTIPEGFTRFDIAKRIAQILPNSIPPPRDAFTDNISKEAQVLELMNDVTLIKDIAPEAKSLEGYMYPSTYNLPRESTAKDAIKMMVEQFRKVWKPEYGQAAAAAGRTRSEEHTSELQSH